MRTKLERKIIKAAAVAAFVFKIKKFNRISIVSKIDEQGSYGTCDSSGNIEIRIKTMKNSKFLSEKCILDTLAHELAHVAEWDHNSKHRRVTSAIKVWLERNWAEIED